jgi:hypothetical protein
MDRLDYVSILDRALASWGGIRLDLPDERTARRVRRKLYAARDDLRAEARAEPPTTPAVTYDTNGKLLGVIDILRRRKPPPTRYDVLRMRLWGNSVYIFTVNEQPRRVDELAPPEAHDIEIGELAELPQWPPWGAQVSL